LIVKDHPVAIGKRPLSYYKRIKKIPNVKMLFNFEDGYKIVENCTGVITICGTTGWEALLLGKPVITFKKTFYNLAENAVFFVNDFFKLASLLQKLIEDFKPDEELIKKVIIANYNFAYPGKLFPLDSLDDTLSEENLKNLTDAIIAEYKSAKSNLDY